MKTVEKFIKQKINTPAKIKEGYELKKKFDKAKDKVDNDVVIRG